MPATDSSATSPITVVSTGKAGLSRRAMLRLVGLGAAGALLAACGPTPAASPTTAAATSAATPTAAAAQPTATTAPAPTNATAAATPTVAAAKPTAAVIPTSTPVAAPAASAGSKLVPFYTVENDPDTQAYYKRTIDAFRQTKPDVEVKITIYQDENQLQYLTTALQTGTDLGIFNAKGPWIATWARANWLLPLDPMIKAIGADDFLAGTRIVVDGKDYAMPYQHNASALWCRKDLFDKAGLKLPTTYEDLLAATKALNKDGIAGIATGVGAVPELTAQYFTPYLHQSGWSYFDKEGNLTFDKPEVLDAVKRFADVLKQAPKSFANVTYPDIINAYVAGKAAMGTFPGRLGVNTASKAPQIAEATTVIPYPAGPFMTAKLHYGGIEHYVAYAKTKNPGETQAFLQFLTTGERSLDFSMTVPGHLLPPLNSVRAKIKDYKSEFMTKYGSWVTTIADLVPSATNPALSMGSVYNKQYSKISNVCPWGSKIWGSPPIDGTMFQEILLNNKSPETAWKDASTKLKKAADEWKQENPDWKPSSGQ